MGSHPGFITQHAPVISRKSIHSVLRNVVVRDAPEAHKLCVVPAFGNRKVIRIHPDALKLSAVINSLRFHVEQQVFFFLGHSFGSSISCSTSRGASSRGPTKPFHIPCRLIAVSTTCCTISPVCACSQAKAIHSAFAPRNSTKPHDACWPLLASSQAPQIVSKAADHSST